MVNQLVGRLGGISLWSGVDASGERVSCLTEGKVKRAGASLLHRTKEFSTQSWGTCSYSPLRMLLWASLFVGARGQLTNPFPETLELSNLDGTNGFILNGEAAGDLSGYSVSSAGDVNGDGFSDFVIGAYGANPTGRSGAGKSYVVFGSGSYSSVLGIGGVLELSSLNGSNGFSLIGESANDQSGYSVSSAGDVNGDGLADLVISARNSTPSGRIRAGKSYVVFGSRSFSSLVSSGGSLELSKLNGNNGFILNGEAQEDKSGNSVSSVGDMNGDGLADFVIGARFATPSGRSKAGKSYVVFGSRSFSSVLGSGGVLELSSLNGSNGFILNGEAAGDRSSTSVSSAGDINGDGLADLVIGSRYSAPSGKSKAGKSYVVFGSRSFSSVLGSGGVLELSSLNGSNGFILHGEAANDQSGYSVSSAGDVNGDGLGDILIGAHWAAPSGKSKAGRSYVVYGSRSFSSLVSSGGILELSSLNGSNGFILNGESASDESGDSVTSAGDVNGDGLADLVIGAPLAAPAGKSYVVFGSLSFSSLIGSGGIVELSSLNGSNGFILNGEAASDRSGTSVSSAGDVNGDGVTDFLIGASQASPSGISKAGKTYVVFGRKLSQTSSTIPTPLISSILSTDNFTPQQSRQTITTTPTQSQPPSRRATSPSTSFRRTTLEETPVESTQATPRMTASSTSSLTHHSMSAHLTPTASDEPPSTHRKSKQTSVSASNLASSAPSTQANATKKLPSTTPSDQTSTIIALAVAVAAFASSLFLGCGLFICRKMFKKDHPTQLLVFPNTNSLGTEPQASVHQTISTALGSQESTSDDDEALVRPIPTAKPQAANDYSSMRAISKMLGSWDSAPDLVEHQSKLTSAGYDPSTEYASVGEIQSANSEYAIVHHNQGTSV